MALHSHQPFLEIEQIGLVTVARLIRSDYTDEEIIHATGSQLFHLVEELGCRRLLLSFANVKRVASAMLGKVIWLHRKIEKEGGRLALCHIDPLIYDAFHALQLTRLFSIYDQEQERSKAFREAADVNPCTSTNHSGAAGPWRPGEDEEMKVTGKAEFLQGFVWHIYPENPQAAEGYGYHGAALAPVLGHAQDQEGEHQPEDLNAEYLCDDPRHGGYLVLTEDPEPPALVHGWKVEPGHVESNFRSDDGSWVCVFVTTVGSVELDKGKVFHEHLFACYARGYEEFPKT